MNWLNFHFADNMPPFSFDYEEFLKALEIDIFRASPWKLANCSQLSFFRLIPAIFEVWYLWEMRDSAPDARANWDEFVQWVQGAVDNVSDEELVLNSPSCLHAEMYPLLIPHCDVDLERVEVAFSL